MTIARRLQAIVAMVAILVAVGLYANIQISKGAEFHHLNYLHLKFAKEVEERVLRLGEDGLGEGRGISAAEIAGLRRAVEDTRAQPVACLEVLNGLDKLIMRLIGTHRAVTICETDIVDADRALATLERYEAGTVPLDVLLPEMERVSAAFVTNSDAFAPLVEQTVDFIVAAMTTAALVLGIGGIAFSVITMRRITPALAALSETTSALAGGERARNVPAQERPDELGALARAIEVFRQAGVREAEETRRRLDSERAEAGRGERLLVLVREHDASVEAIMGRIRSGLESVNRAGDTMTRVASSGRDHAGAVENSVARTRETVRAVASATEELTATIQEIGTQANDAAARIAAASTKAEDTNARVETLAKSAETIVEVVDLIDGIAEKTNLLALNATIEAARAGEAGKGFAVVAGEVKTLARQTTEATARIAEQISEMRRAVDNTVEAMGDIRSTISDANGATGAIAGAVTQQSAASHEIATQTSEASASTESLAEHMGLLNGEMEANSEAVAAMQESYGMLRGELDGMISQNRAFGSEVKRFQGEARG